MDNKKSKPGRSFGRLFKKSVSAALLFSVVVVFLLRFIPPPTSAFIVARYCKGFLDSGSKGGIKHHWVSWKEISPHVSLAVVAAEDQKFPKHFGFDFESISEALEESESGRRLRGASTISQQTAKNLFLWNGRSIIRKGLEAYCTFLMELLWPKRRILEVYLNIAEFGDGIYGVGAAAESFFGKAPSRLTRQESALLASVLPNPKKLRVKAPSAYVMRRSKKIERQMKNLGTSYLKTVAE